MSWISNQQITAQQTVVASSKIFPHVTLIMNFLLNAIVPFQALSPLYPALTPHRISDAKVKTTGDIVVQTAVCMQGVGKYI